MHDPSLRARAIRRVLLVILALNWLVAAAKWAVAWASHSLSVQADAYHSLLDGASNIVGLVAITLAAEDPDREHPYGHRKFEVLGALAIGVMLALAAYTSGSAFAEFQDGDKGTLVRGQLADLVILSDDILAGTVRIQDVTVLTTVVGGKVVHQRRP